MTTLAIDPTPATGKGTDAAPAPRRACREGVMTSWDGAELFYRAWLPAGGAGKALLLFHRGHEHSGRFQDLVDGLALDDFAVFAWDARGHGRSPGERGSAENFAAVVRDMDAFARFVCREHGLAMRDVAALGHSVAAVGVAAWVHDYAPPLRAMVLATPALRVKLYVPFALPSLRLRTRLFGRSFIKSYVKASMLTHDRASAADYQSDPLVSRSIATHILIDLHDTATRLLADAGAIRTPALVLRAGADWVVKNSAQRRFYERLGSPVKDMRMKDMRTYDGFYHSILHEKDRARVISDVRAFLLERFEVGSSSRNELTSDPTPRGSRGAPAPVGAEHRIEDHRSEDLRGDVPAPAGGEASGAIPANQAAFDRLSRPLSPLSPRRWNYAVQRFWMKTLCRLSRGVNLGWRAGFDSGESLDYVYRNRPQGATPLGRLIDRFYLNAVGWRGIRQRKIHLQEALGRAVREVRAAGGAVRIVDVAAGAGRYTLEFLKGLPAEDAAATTALLRDRSASALEAGRRTAAEMGVANVTFAAGDAFDAASLAALNPRPNVAVVSGLYELFPDNRLVAESLRGLAGAAPPGGFLVYTNQPWHPQLEMIARVLVNREGRPWVMRCRPQAEMDGLVRAAGFEKLETWIDAYGIFTVSLARRNENP